MRTTFQLVLLGAVFTGLYFGLRALPATNCKFLHYEETQVTADGVEFCAAGPAMFVDLSRLQFPVALQLEPDAPLAAGRPARVTLELTLPGGQALRPSELAITHTRKLHLLLVDESLGDYQHIHPEPEGDSGKWTFTFTPRAGGRYRALAEAVPVRTRRQVVGDAALAVAGAPAVAEPRRAGAESVQGEYIFALAVPAAPEAGADLPLQFTVRRADGGPVQLEPVMAAYGHVVAFDAARRGYAHLHPVYSGREDDPAQPALDFLFNTPVPGRYRIWAQVKLDGEERFAPFDLEVRPADS